MVYALTYLLQCVLQIRVQHKTSTIKIGKINNFYQQVIFPGAFKRCQYNFLLLFLAQQVIAFV